MRYWNVLHTSPNMNDALSVTSNEAHEWKAYSKTRTNFSKRIISEKELFAIKTAALLYLRGVNSKLEFQLACDVEEADNFVDFVLKYKAYDEPKKWHTSFIQLQPKTDVDDQINTGTLTNSKSAALSLQKYFKSFSYLKRKMVNQDEDLLFNGSIDRCDFILYTNIMINRKLANRRRGKIDAACSTFLTSKEESSRVVHFTEESDRDIYSAMVKNGPEAKEFLKKLLVFPGQPNISEMDKLIKMELELFCTHHKKHVNTVFSFFIDAVETWWKNDHVRFLNNNSSILENSIQHFAALCISSEQKKAFTIGITFNNNALEPLRKMIMLPKKDKKLCRILTNRRSLKMSCTKVLQILKSEGELCSFVSLKSLVKEESIIIPCWQQGRNKFLVIVCTRWSYRHDSIVNNIVRVLDEHRKRVIIVHSPRDIFADTLRGALDHRSDDYPDIFKTSQLSEDLVTSIATTKMVLQDANVIYLQDLIDIKSRPSEILMSNNFFEIFNRETIYVGNKITEIAKYYIPRVLVRSNVLDERILRNYPAKGVIAVSGVSKTHLEELVSPEQDEQIESKCSFLHLRAKTASEDFNKLSSSTSNVHWLHVKENRLEWIRSRGNISHISKYIDNTMCKVCTPMTAFDVTDERIVLIAAEEGAGKSTMIADIAQNTKKAHPATWVILVDLGNTVNLLRQDGDVNATAFLMAAVGIDAKSPLERDLFRFCIEQSGNAVLLLDGLNDADDLIMQKVYSLLTSLMQTRVSKVWITTNNSTANKLEKVLSTFAFNIQKLSGDAEKVISGNTKRIYKTNYF